MNRNLWKPCFLWYYVWTDPLTLSWRRSLSYKNQSIDSPLICSCKSMDWFLYERNLRHVRVWSPPKGNTYLKPIIQFLAAGLFKYVWPFSGNQALMSQEMISEMKTPNVKIVPLISYTLCQWISVQNLENCDFTFYISN